MILLVSRRNLPGFLAIGDMKYDGDCRQLKRNNFPTNLSRSSRSLGTLRTRACPEGAPPFQREYSHAFGRFQQLWYCGWPNQYVDMYTAGYMNYCMDVIMADAIMKLSQPVSTLFRMLRGSRNSLIYISK